MMMVGGESRFLSLAMRSIVSSPTSRELNVGRTTSAPISAMRASASSPLDASSTETPRPQHHTHGAADVLLVVDDENVGGHLLQT
jgi:hypothetical protein